MICLFKLISGKYSFPWNKLFLYENYYKIEIWANSITDCYTIGNY